MVYCKTGRPEIANDVMGVHQTDVWTMLKPQDEWRPGLTRDDLIEEMDKLLTENVPGVKFGFSQPIEMRVNELVAGVKSDVAALLYGPDLDVLRRLALRDRAGARRGSRAPTTSRRRRPAGCRCCGSRSAATSSRATGSRRPTCSTPSPRSAARPSARSSRGQAPAPAPGPAPRVVAERPRADRLDPDRRPQGPADPAAATWPTSPRGRPQRGRARERPAPGGGRGQRPGPRHRRVRRRGPGRDRRARSSCPPGYIAPLGRPVRAPADGHAAAR